MSRFPPSLLQSLPFMEGQHRPALGIQALSPNSWIICDESLGEELELKRELLHRRRDEVLKLQNEDRAPAQELLRLLVSNLVEFHADRYALQGNSITNLTTSEIWDVIDPAVHPLEVAARLVQEDLCLLTEADNQYLLTGAAVCFPSNWHLAEKIGNSASAIHAPVADYNGKMAAAVNRFFEHLRPNRIVWRLNWSIQEQPALFQPERLLCDQRIVAENAGSALWLRAERRTLLRLPMSNAIAFTIRTFVDRLQDVVVDAEVARKMGATIRSMPKATLDYRSMMPIMTPLLSWLDARAMI